MIMCVVSTLVVEGELVKTKWVDNHIHNQHTGQSELYPKCSHGDLLGEDRQKK